MKVKRVDAGRGLAMVVFTISLLVPARPSSCAGAAYPVLFPVAKDAATSLYTIPARLGDNLVVDLAGPLVWSTCSTGHLRAFSCDDPQCNLANEYHAPGQRGCAEKKAVCTARPYNPVTGRCAAGALVHTRLVGNTTDRRNPVSQVSVRAVASCAPRKLLASLPRDATGVAGMGRSGLALPAQVASSHGVAKKLLLCLPSGGGDGVAIFGGGPLHLLPPWLLELTSTLAYTSLVSNKDNPAAYYISVKTIAVNQAQVTLPVHALAGAGAVLCTRVPYTLLRPDVYRPFVAAFDKATAAMSRVTPAVAPFELCYDAAKLGSTRLGYAVPPIDLTLEGGRNWTVFGGNSMVRVSGSTACLAFVEMKGVKATGDGGAGGAPAVVIGGFQTENNLVQLDMEKGQLGFSGLLWGRQTTCSNFNFNWAYH